MSQASYGGLKARPARGLPSEAASSAVATHPFSYPGWMKVLFLIGAILFLASIVGLIVSPLANGLLRPDILFGTAALGLGALLVVTRAAPKYRPRG